MNEFHVITECGRNFVISHHDTQSCMWELKEKGYRVLLIEPYTEYETEVEKQEQQVILHAEHEAEIEGDAA